MPLLKENSLQLFLAIFSVFVVSRVLRYRKNLQTTRLPGLRVPFHPLGVGAVLPSTWWNLGIYSTWTRRHSLYKEFGNETFSVIPFLSAAQPAYYTSNLNVIKQLGTGGKTCFVKPELSMRVFLLWGENVLSADGETWRKHRRILGPAFNNDLYQMVWSETIKRYREMVVGEGWQGKNKIEVPVVQDLTAKLALLIIAKCGFGFSVDWFEPPRTVDGKMSIQQALKITSGSSTLMVFSPKWFLNLPYKRLRVIREAREQVMSFMKSQIAERKADVCSKSEAELGSDAFTKLIKANEDEAGKFRLDDSELIGNIFILLVAGHETTATVLAATLGFLAYHLEIQSEVLRQILEVVGNRDPIMDDYHKLDKVLAAFYEALRMCPPAFLMIREATEDTTLTIPNPHGQEGISVIPVPKGAQVFVDMIGLQYNPRYFEDPEQFKPSRWAGVSAESEIFSAFGVGSRACIGRKFATIEAICFLTMLLRDYEVVPRLKLGETKEEWKNRFMKAKITITLSPQDISLTFVKRA